MTSTEAERDSDGISGHEEANPHDPQPTKNLPTEAEYIDIYCFFPCYPYLGCTSTLLSQTLRTGWLAIKQNKKNR